MADRLQFRYSELGEISQSLSTAIFAVFPNLEPFAFMMQSGETDGLSITLVVPSPTNDLARSVEIWVDEVATPSIAFGPSHTHEAAAEDGIATIVDTAKAIFEDQLLIIEDVGGAHSGFATWIDLRIPDALAEELTDPNSPGRAFLRSWSGNADQEVSTASLP